METFDAGGSVALTLADLFTLPLANYLTYYGFMVSVGQIIKSYLTDRNQMLSVKGAKSQLLLGSLECPSPQDSVIDPVLFLVTMNDLDQLGYLLLFTDTTQPSI